MHGFLNVFGAGILAYANTLSLKEINEIVNDENFESFNFTEEEFRKVLASEGLQISELIAMTMNEEKWRSLVNIETSGYQFPEEHILILAQQTGHFPQPAPRKGTSSQ